MDAGEVRARLSLSMDGWSQSINRAQSDLRDTGRAASDTKKSFEDISKAGVILGGAVVGALGMSIKSAADFESSMSKVKAITNATDSDFALLTQTAQDFGASTIYTSEQVSEAMYNLGASGYSTSQIIAAMPGLLNLAAAAQVDLGQASDITTGIMQAFGLEAEKTGYIVDVLASAANNSNVSIPELGESFKYVGPVAKSLGLSVEEVASALSIMGNAGIKGSDAGTALRASLLALANPVGQGAKAIEDLGIKVTTADGQMKPLPELLATIGGKLNGMTDAQKTATVAQLVGTEAASGFLSLISAGPDKLKDFEKSLKDSGGTAEKVAKTQMDNLNGQLEQFKGALSGIAVEIGQDFLPALTEVAKKAADVISKLDDTDLANLKAGLSFGGTAAAILTTGGALGKMAFAVRGLLLAMGPVGFAIAGLALVGGAVAAVVTRNKEMEASRLKIIETGFDEVRSLDATIKAYDDLKMKSHLTNDEFGRYLDLQAELKRTSDPNAIAKIKDEMAHLQEKSGLSNKELSDMIGYNQDIVKKTPEVAKAISDQGQAYVDNTRKVKDYNQAKLASLYDDLEIKRLQNETKYKDTLEKEKDLIEKRHIQEKDLQGLLDKRASAKTKERDEEQILTDMLGNRSKYTDIEVQQQRSKVKLAKDDVDLAQNRVEKQAESIGKSKEQLDTTQAELKKLEDVKFQMAQILIHQAGINAKKGEEVNAIDSAIGKLQAQKQELINSTPAAQRNTQEFRDAKSAIDSQIGSLETTKRKIIELTGEASALNDELGKEINKQITETHYQSVVNIVDQGRRAAGGPQSSYHTGGLVGRAQMPTLHTGGLASQFANMPNHNEVDVRLLRNEMVLTEGQQANLMRMLDAGFTQKSGQSGIGKQFNYDVKVDAKNVDMDEQQLVRTLQRMEALYGG